MIIEWSILLRLFAWQENLQEIFDKPELKLLYGGKECGLSARISRMTYTVSAANASQSAVLTGSGGNFGTTISHILEANISCCSSAMLSVLPYLNVRRALRVSI